MEGSLDLVHPWLVEWKHARPCGSTAYFSPLNGAFAKSFSVCPFKVSWEVPGWLSTSGDSFVTSLPVLHIVFPVEADGGLRGTESE